MAIPKSAARFSLCLGLIAMFVGIAPLSAQNAKDQAAFQLLKNADRAYQERNFPAAIQQYRQFLSAHAGHSQAPAARHSLALALLELPQPDYAGALEQLKILAGSKELSEYPSVLYHMGLALRGLGEREQSQAAGASSAEAAKRETSAQQHYREAAKQFAAAAAAFAERIKKTHPPQVKPEFQASARARCDQADMLLRTHQAKEAREVLSPLLRDSLLAKDEQLSRLAHYYDGAAAFLLKDYSGAGRGLSAAAPFRDPDYGTHARFLLARVHQLMDERAEAAAHCDGLLADYENQKKDATQTLRTPEILRNPRKRTQLEQLVRGPVPEHVAETSFYLGILHAEAGRFNDAQGRFAAFLKQSPKSPLAIEAQLRLGICQVNTKQGAQALRTLQPLAGRESPLDDQAMFWIGKAHEVSVEPNNQAQYKQALLRSAEALDQAARKAGAAADPDGRTRAALARIELADVLQRLAKAKEAAAIFQQVLADNALPGRKAELLQHLVEALSLAGDFDESDKACERFQKQFPRNPLRPAVLFRYAENAAFRYLAAEKAPNGPNRVPELKRLGDEAAKRYEAVVSESPEFEYASRARYGLALNHYRRGELEKAANLFAAIPGPDRQGDLAIVSYLHADCLIRQCPAKVEDAVAAGKVREALEPAIEQLEAFAGSQTKGSPLAADAILKLGHCYQRLAALTGQPAERTKLLQNARTGYKKIYAGYPPQHPAHMNAVFEEAKCFVQMNVPQRALTNLQRFTQAPLADSPIAPLALLQLGNLMRGQNRSSEAAAMLNHCRERYGPILLKDPARAAWYPLILLYQGICLKEAGNFSDARGLFETITRDFPAAPEAPEAALRFGQCLQDEGMRKTERARQQLAAANKPEQIAAAVKLLGEDLKLLREAAQHLEAQAARFKGRQPPIETRARMLYDAAWINRVLAEVEAKADGGADRLPPAEQKARTLYQELIAAFTESPLAIDARFELAELMAQRGDGDAAIKLLQETLDAEPSPELTEKIRIRLGTCLATKGDTKAALVQFDVVAKNAKGKWAEVARRQGRQLKESKPLAALPPLGQPRPDRASLDDPTTAASFALVQSAITPPPLPPAPFLRLTLPDPYEFHYPIRMPLVRGENAIR